MRDYSKISPALWQSKRFNTLPSDDARYLMFYLLTNRHQNSAGAYELPDGYAISDLRWPLERYRTALEELSVADLVRFDPETEVMMIAGWFRHNPPMNAKHLQGIERILHRLPSPEIAQEALVAAREAWEAWKAEPEQANRPAPLKNDWAKWKARSP